MPIMVTIPNFFTLSWNSINGMPVISAQSDPQDGKENWYKPDGNCDTAADDKIQYCEQPKVDQIFCLNLVVHKKHLRIHWLAHSNPVIEYHTRTGVSTTEQHF